MGDRLSPAEAAGRCSAGLEEPAVTAIRQLPPQLINEIAAGEVVDRPASVVKELLENSVDAGASRVGVSIVGGGVERLEISDDGCGIPFAELPLAVAPHATSKIRESRDLGRITTLGFRGEALASIASVSRLLLRSRPREQSEAGEIEVHAGSVSPARPAAGPFGTRVVVEQLFLNVPARRKFLKSAATETARAAEVVRTLAIARPELAVRLEIDGRTALDLPGSADHRRRVVAVLGRESEGQLLEIDAEEGGVRVFGLVGRPEIAKGSGRSTRIVLNGRAIHDRLILHAIREGFRGCLPGDRHPVAAIHLVIDPSEVDVNVHPAKAEVRFRNGPLVHAAIRHAVRAAVSAAEGTPHLETFPAAAARRTTAPASEVPARFGSGGPTGSLLPLPERAGPRGFDYSRAASELALAEGLPAAAASLPRAVLQAGGTFLVAADEEGLVIVDKHALHERLEYDRLARRICEGPLERQSLLSPEIVEVGAAGVEAFEVLEPLLAKIGLEASPAGLQRLAITAVPSLFASRRVDAAEFLQEVLDRSARSGAPGDEQSVLDAILSMMACKAAVRAGEDLTPPEASSLLDRAAEVELSGRCPHGRPTMLRLPWGDLRRRFGRS